MQSSDDVIAARTAAFRSQIAAMTGGEVQDFGTVGASRTHVPIPGLNGVWPLGPAARVDDVRAALTYVAAAEVPCSVQLRAGYDETIDALLADRGFESEPGDPLMVADVAPKVEVPAGLQLRLAATSERSTFVGVVAAGFGAPVELFDQMVPVELAALADVRLWVGELDGEPVTTVLSCRGGGGSGLFAVATPPAHQRRGFSAALTAHVVASELAAGSRFVWLQSSAEAYRMYQALGFDTLETWTAWTST